MMNRASFRVRSFGSSACLSTALGACACACVLTSGSPIAAAVTANHAEEQGSPVSDPGLHIIPGVMRTATATSKPFSKPLPTRLRSPASRRCRTDP